MERIKKAILLVFSFIFALFLCFIFSDLVYHFQTGEWYYKKGSLCKKISKAYTKSMEYELGRYPSKTVKDLSINIGLDKIQDWTKREVGQNVGLVCFEKEITLNFLDFKAVNRGEYSLSFSVGLNEEFDSSCYVSLMVNKNEEWLSHKQIFPKDVLTAVLPSRPRCLRSPKVLLRVYCFKDSMPKLLRPALVLTPIYAKYEKSNYHESFSFKKGNKIRILAIGGSTTYGTSNEQNTTWPSILQQKLNVLYPNKFEVLNLGIWGGSVRDFIESYDLILAERYHTLDYLQNPEGLKNIFRYNFGYKDLKPDIVIIAPCWNDITLMLFSSSSGKSKLFGLSGEEMERSLGNIFEGNHTALGYYLHRFLANVASNNIDLSRLKQEDASDTREYSSSNSKDFSLENIEKKYRDNLRVLVEKFKEINCKVVLLSLPSIVWDPSIEINEKFRTKMGWDHKQYDAYSYVYNLGGGLERNSISIVSDEAKAGYIDFFKLFDKINNVDKLVNLFSDQIHFTDLGNEYLSSVICENLREEFSELVRLRPHD